MGLDSYLPLKKSGQSVIRRNLPYRFLRGQPLKWCFARVKNDTKTFEKNWHKLSNSFKYIYIFLFTISYFFNPVPGLLIIIVAGIILCSSIN